MAVNLRILVPDDTTNYVQNPSARYDTTGWTAFGSAISRTLDYARFGIASLKIITTGAATREGTFYRVSNLTGVSEIITASIYARGTGRVHLRLIDASGGVERISAPTVLLADRWQRLEVTCQSSGGNDMRLYLETDDKIQAITFYADGAQMERKPYATTYCDGDQPGCRWSGLYHSSLSTRSPYTRAGGRWVDLAGPCRREDDIYVTLVGGMGALPISNQIQSFSLEPGSYFQNSKILDRRITLTFHTKDKKLIAFGKPNLGPLHKLREQLLDLLKPDVTLDSEEFLLEYDEGDWPLYIRARYESGLEGEWDIRNQWVNSFPVVLYAADPLFQEDSQEVQQLQFDQQFYTSAGTFVELLARRNGTWSAISPDGSGFFSGAPRVRCLAVGTKGEIYVGGVQLIAKWDGTTWTDLGALAVAPNKLVRSIAVHRNGDVYITGTFTAVGGVAATNIARWDGTNWNALGAGINGSGNGLVIGDDGYVYVCGSFTTAGGIASRGLARWTGTAWEPIPGITGGIVQMLAKWIDGKTIFAVGQSLPAGVAANNRMISIDTATRIITMVGDAVSAIFCLTVQKDGTVFIGGGFTQNNTTGAELKKVAFWNGKAWYQLGTGAPIVDGTKNVLSIAVDPESNIYIGGNFDDVGDVPNHNFAKWTGDRRSAGKWNSPDVLVNATAATLQQINFILIHPNGDLYICADAMNGVHTSYMNTVVNPGTSEVSPVLYVRGQGYLRYLKNWTTGGEIVFNLSILAGEEVRIDFAAGTVISTVRGNLSNTVLPVSSLKDFSLLPGENKVAAFMTNGFEAAMQISLVPQHASADATARVEALQ